MVLRVLRRLCWSLQGVPLVTNCGLFLPHVIRSSYSPLIPPPRRCYCINSWCCPTTLPIIIPFSETFAPLFITSTPGFLILQFPSFLLSLVLLDFRSLSNLDAGAACSSATFQFQLVLRCNLLLLRFLFTGTQLVTTTDCGAFQFLSPC